MSSNAMKEAAGILLYRKSAAGLEVLLVHPSGNYNRKAPWSIPKGLPDQGEELAHAACRETLEEAGIAVTGALSPVGFVDYSRSRKRVFCFISEAGADCTPHCASWEVDGAEFVPVNKARQIIHPDQVAFIDRLIQALEKREAL